MNDQLPNGWTEATPIELASTEPHALAIGPFGSNLKVPDYRHAGVPLVFVRNIVRREFGGDASRYVTEQKAEELRAHRVLPGDLLITKMGAPPGDVAVYPKSAPPAIITADCIRFACNDSVTSAEYLEYAMQSPRVKTQFAEITQGVAQLKVSLGRFSTIRIPVSPIREQQRIVAALDERLSELDASVASLERAERNLVRYRAAVLAAACSGKLVPTEADLAHRAGRSYEPADQLLARILAERRKVNTKAKYEEPAQPDTSKLPKLPEGWTWATVEQLATVGSGNTPAQIADHLQPHGAVPWYKVGDMNRPGNERVMRSAEGYLSAESVRTLRIRPFPPGTIIFPKRGGAIATNKKRLLENEATTDLNVMGLTPPKELLPYFWLWFQSVDLGSLSDGSNIPQVNNQDILPVFVPLAPTSEQERIVAEVESHLSRADALAASIAQSKRRAQRLRRAILAAAFQGRLVLQDPNDEPASVLLDRIRAQAATTPAPVTARGPRVANAAFKRASAARSQEATAPARAAEPAATYAAQAPKRRGRPPGSKNKAKA